VTDIGFNPGGLQNFRKGTNRKTSSAFTGYIDNIQIWDDSQVVASFIAGKGPGVNAVPAPGAILLLGPGIVGMAASRRRLG
jgi:hypothetical protein